MGYLKLLVIAQKVNLDISTMKLICFSPERTVSLLKRGVKKKKNGKQL